jgi:hypothetical protein
MFKHVLNPQEKDVLQTFRTAFPPSISTVRNGGSLHTPSSFKNPFVIPLINFVLFHRIINPLLQTNYKNPTIETKDGYVQEASL